VLAVLGYRIVNYWLPLIPGAIAYIRLSLRRDGETKPATTPSGALKQLLVFRRSSYGFHLLANGATDRRTNLGG